MDTHFEFYDLVSGIHAGDFNCDENALSFLAPVLATEGPQLVADYGLSEGARPGQPKTRLRW